MATKTAATAGQALRDLRAELGLTQDEMAAKTRVNQGHISSVENGHKRLTADVALRITMKLGVDPMRLIRHVDPNGPEPGGTTSGVNDRYHATLLHLDQAA